MSQTKRDADGYPYRVVLVNGAEFVISPYSTKHTIFAEYGAVFVGPPYTFTTPEGKTLAGYTDEPVFVQEYREMWEEK